MLHDLAGSENKVVHDYKVSGSGCRISRVRQTRSGWCFRISRIRNNSSNQIRTGLQDLTGKEHHIVHAYEVSGWGCKISRVRNNSSNMHTRYPDGAAGSHGLGITDPTCITRHQKETLGSHWFETPDRTCLLGVRTALHDLTGSEHKIVHAYKVSGRGCKISRIRNTKSYMTRGYQEGAAGSHG